MVPKQVLLLVEQKLKCLKGNNCDIFSTSIISGGCINTAAKLETSSGNYFLKWNSRDAFPGMFEVEAKGLKLLRKQNTLKIPAVVFSGEGGNEAFLLLEYIEEGPNTSAFWKDFGKQLAALHRVTSPVFGLDHNNYIGLLPQNNRENKNWNSFFIEGRLQPQIKLAREKGAITKGAILKFENLFKKLDEIFPSESPALIHGDLWNGNFMAGKNGEASVFDPAVYFGHREMDIAMSKLFGGFHQQFYESYNYHFPLQKGWANRIAVCNLYPLMVHVNLFGGGYIQQVEQVLGRF